MARPRKNSLPDEQAQADSAAPGQQPSTGDNHAAVDQLQPAGEDQVAAGKVMVYPLRTYQDQGELKRHGGKGYFVTPGHAQALIARRLATDTEPKKD